MQRSKNVGSSLRLALAGVSLIWLINNATIVAYSKDSAAEAKVKAEAAAKAAAHKHKAPTKLPSVSSSINPKRYGAVGDGKHDDQAAIDAAIAAARASRKTVSFPAGNYLHSSVIVVNGVALMGAGPNSTTLTGSDALNCAVQLTGNNPSFRNFNIHGVNVATEPMSMPNDLTPREAAIWVNAASNFMVEGNTITGLAGSNGIDISNCQTGTVSNNMISNIKGTGINLSASSDVQLVKNSVQKPGMCPLCIAGYGSASENIIVDGNLFEGGSAELGSGIYLSTLQTCQFTNNNCTTNPLYLFTWENRDQSNNVLVSENSFKGTLNYAICANNRHGSDTKLTITGNTIENVVVYPQNDTFAIYVNSVQGVNVFNNKISNSPGFGVTVTGSSNIVIDSNTLNNIGWEAIAVRDYGTFERNSGSIDVSNNQISNCGTNPVQGGGPVLEVSSLANASPPFLCASLSIVGNTLTGPANYAKYYIYCTIPSNDGVSGFTRTISGDSQGTSLLPNSIAP